MKKIFSNFGSKFIRTEEYGENVGENDLLQTISYGIRGKIAMELSEFGYSY